MRLIDDYIRTLLTEDAPWDQAEIDAKAAYENAEAELAEWDKQKLAFDKKVNMWEDYIRAWANGERKTRGLKPKKPTRSEFPMLKFQRKKYLNARDKLKDTYALYEPSLSGYKRKRTSSDEETDNSQLPEEGTHAFADFGALKQLHWYSWPTEIQTSGVSYKPTGQGIGPGEDWFAWLFGGRVQGEQVSFDIVLADGGRWELKSIANSNSSFRTGTEGLQSTAYARSHLVKMMQQMRSFSQMVVEFHLDDGLDDKIASMIDHIVTFTEDEFDDIITKGEITVGRLRALRRATITVHDLLRTRDEVLDAKNDDRPNSVVTLDDEEFNVTQPTFISVAQQVQRDVQKDSSGKQVDVLNRYEELDVALSIFDDNAFDNPRGYWAGYFKMIQVEDAFKQVDGVVMIHSDGFMKIPKSLLSQALTFKGMTMGGRPYYAMSNFGSGPAGAPTVPITPPSQASSRSPRR
jgi:hypothetical protein